MFLAGAVSMVVRFRRSGQEQRQQLKWFVYASAVSALVVAVAAFGTSNPLPAFEIIVPLIPAAVGIAIFKYRLYDIDRLISRTLAYVIVTGLLVGVYAGLVILAGVLGFSTPPAVAVATLAAAALFSPLRRRVQRAVDKRFNRVRYDAELTVAAFATRLRDAVDLDTVRAELLGVVDSAVQPAHLSVWTAGPRKGEESAEMRILVAGWDSGGGVEAVQTVVRRAVARGHQVRVLGTEGLRDRFESAGASFRVYRYAPDNDCRSAETDLIKEWEARTPLGQFARVRDRVMFGPAREFCRDVVEELDREPADLVVVDTLIPSALSGAEAAGCPSVLLMHGPYLMPRPGAPPPGSGFMPARGRLGRWRDRAAASLLMRVFRTGMPALNQARAEFGLAPLRDLGDVLNTVGRVLVCTSPSYDFAAGDRAGQRPLRRPPARRRPAADGDPAAGRGTIRAAARSSWSA